MAGNNAYLILEDGTVLMGDHIGADRDVISEVVFNTSMAGYLEVLTDPSYAGQAVTMTYPLIGNYGVCRDDMESGRAWPDAFIVRELARRGSNFRRQEDLSDFLLQQGIPGIAGIDTRALVCRLRDRGTMNGYLTTDSSYDLGQILPRIKEYKPSHTVERVSCKAAYDVSDSSIEQRFHVALLDLGAKRNISRSLAARGCRVTIWPQDTSASEILDSRPDGIMLSNGPGDPADCGEIIKQIRALYDSDIPIFAICLGHQLMALATGAATYKLKYGHRGGNHPVRDLASGRVYITSQNHGYAVDTKTLNPAVAVCAFENVNDGTNEGLRYIGKDIFTVQFHPEACPGPQDTGWLFDRFIAMMEDRNA